MLTGDAILLWQFQAAQAQGERLRGVDEELITVLQAHANLMSFYEVLDVVAHSEDTAQLCGKQKISTILSGRTVVRAGVP